MAIPIRTELDYQGVCRRFFEIDVLAQGQIARYDKDIECRAFVVAKRAKVEEWLVEGEYVEPTTFEIFAPASIRLSEIQRRRFNILDRTQEKLRIATQIQEDDQWLALIHTTCGANLSSNPLVQDNTNGCSKAFLNKLTSEIMDHDLPCYGLVMRFSSYKDIRDWGSTDLDPVTMRELLNTGLRGTLWGIDIIVTRRQTAGRVHALAEPRFLGVMPIRTDYLVMPDDVPKKAEIGYVGYEEVGMVAINANGTAEGQHNVLT
jgi:hypothetical protein